MILNVIDWSAAGDNIARCFVDDMEHVGVRPFLEPSLEEYIVGPRRFFGSYCFPWLAQVVDLRDEAVVAAWGKAYLWARGFVICQDKALDEAGNPLCCLLAPFFLHRFISLMQQMPRSFDSTIESLLKTTFTANIEEHHTHHNRISDYTCAELQNLYKKTSLFILPATIVPIVSKKEYASSDLCSITRSMLIGIQLFDDLADIDVDFAARDYTFPVTHGLRLSGKSENSPDACYRGLVGSGLLEGILSFQRELLVDAAQRLHALSMQSLLYGYLNDMVAYNDHLQSEITAEKAKQQIPDGTEHDIWNLKPVRKTLSFDPTPFKRILARMDAKYLMPDNVRQFHMQ